MNPPRAAARGDLAQGPVFHDRPSPYRAQWRSRPAPASLRLMPAGWPSPRSARRRRGRGMNRPPLPPRRIVPRAPPIETQRIEIMIAPAIRRAGGRHIRRRPRPSRRRVRRRASEAMQAISTAIAAISPRPATLALEARRQRLLTNCLTVWACCRRRRDSESSTAVSTGRRAARGRRAFLRRRGSRIGAGSRRRQGDRQRVGVPSSPFPSPPAVVRKAAPQSGSSSRSRSSAAAPPFGRRATGTARAAGRSRSAACCRRPERGV